MLLPRPVDLEGTLGAASSVFFGDGETLDVRDFFFIATGPATFEEPEEVPCPKLTGTGPSVEWATSDACMIFFVSAGVFVPHRRICAV